MKLKKFGSLAPALTILLAAALACTLGQAGPGPQNAPSPLAPTAPQLVSAIPPTTETNAIATVPPDVQAVSIDHKTRPADVAVAGKLVYDVESSGTAPESRAPYGDSYNINRLERPFLQGMIYVPDLDISTFSVGQDSNWYYVTITLMGNDPNNKLGINYGVELDVDHDGFGDYLIWAKPPYSSSWATSPVQVFKDTNHDTGGISPEKSDAPLKGDGYDTQIFNGGNGDADPDLAWVRANNGLQGTVQFAFKRSWSGNTFMLGVLADAGLRDPRQFDYVDRIPLAEAGSPVRDNSDYPLKALLAVDNDCRTAVGFKPTGYEPQLCPVAEPPAKRPPKPAVTPSGCQDPGYCSYGWDPVWCMCIIGWNAGS